MGVGESLRKAAGYFGGGSHDEYDRYDLEDDEPEGRDGTHTLVLVRPTSRDFFLAVPHVFDDVQAIGTSLKADTAVIVDLHSCEAGLTERVVDFCGGLVYALGGGFYRIGDKVLLLSPSSVDFSTELGAEAFRHQVFGRA
jgi:cell division inhibitor SepF